MTQKNEPLLNGHSDADINFGNSNDYYHDMYIFDNSEIKDHTYTLHLEHALQKLHSRYKDTIVSHNRRLLSILGNLNDIDNMI